VPTKTEQTASPIGLDCDPYGIVIYCTEHPWWRAFRFYKDEAWDAACAHEEREHTGDYRQRKARSERTRRAAH
jgi:hypothetical protein